MEWEGDKATETLYHVTCDISKITFSQRGNTMHFHSEFFQQKESCFNTDLIDG